MNKAALTLLQVLLIAGCAAPGLKIPDPPDTANVEVLPITARLLADQATDRERIAKASRDLPESKGSNKYGKSSYKYSVTSGDILNITVWDHPELTIPAGEYRTAEQAGHLVRQDGTIFYPYAGTIRVAGKTTADVRNMLTRRVARYIANPQLDVRVAAFRGQRCYVVGEVETPGMQTMNDMPMTVVDALAHAGRMTEEADLGNATLTRDGQVRHIDLLSMYQGGDMSDNMLMRAGDVLYIPNLDQRKIFVLGEVGEQKSMMMRDGRLTLAEALADAGGVDRITSNPGQIYVIRGTPEKSRIFHLNSKSSDGLLLADAFQLEPRDVVYVGAAGVSSWNRVINQILPTSTVLRDSAAIPR